MSNVVKIQANQYADAAKQKLHEHLVRAGIDYDLATDIVKEMDVTHIRYIFRENYEKILT